MEAVFAFYWSVILYPKVNYLIKIYIYNIVLNKINTNIINYYYYYGTWYMPVLIPILLKYIVTMWPHSQG